MSFIRGSAAPGVHATVNTSFIGAPAQPDSSDKFFAVVYATWGPLNRAVTITGAADLGRNFGGLHPNSHGMNALHNFFRQGGRRAVVVRVAGAAAAVATVTLVDRAGAPLDTVRVDAKYPSSTVDVRVRVETGSVANTVKLTFRSVALGAAVPVEIFDNVKLAFTQVELNAIAAGASSLTTLAQINERSVLVKLTDLGSATLAPNNLPALSAVVNGVVQETVLAGGSDDFAGVDAARFIGVDNGVDPKTGLQVFNSEDFGAGQVALPGVTTQAAHAALVAHAEVYKRFAILDLPLGTTKDAAVTARRLIGSSYAAMYWPWVEQLDLEGVGIRKFYPPSGHVAGVFARAEAEIGVHKAPANYVLRGVLDVERAANGSPQVDEGTRAHLNQNEVNAIVPITEQGVKVYGARVLASFGRVTAVHQQRVLNQIYYDLKKSYQEIPYAVYDLEGKLFREVRSLTSQYLRSLHGAGSLTSPTGKPEDSYVVVCDISNNPPETIDQHQFNVQVGVYIPGMAEMVFLDINNVPLATSLAVLSQA